MSKEGLKVAQIGCDPKHDSTRLLLGGRTQTTVLDHINSGSDDLGDTISVGKNGILCIETGGPEPGVGCAGRGILTAFNFMENNSVISKDVDIMLYDVLGDVVCGGFAVPLRRKYADAVFIVTSGEFMSLYAANNVLKGIRNFDNDKCRVAGLILNMRGNDGEYEYVKNFADAVGLPIVTRIPRSPKFSEAESQGVTISEMFPGSEEYEAIGNIVDAIKGLDNGNHKLHRACPLNDDDLDLVAKGIPVPKRKTQSVTSRELAVDERNVLKGCGAFAACNCCLGIKDADIILHGPKSCHYFFTSSYDSAVVFEKKAKVLGSSSDRIYSTDLTDHSSIFGGIKELRDLIRSRAEAGTKTIFVITTCVPGIIGDDVEGACSDVVSEFPGTNIIPIISDGILNGGSYQNRGIALTGICRLVDKTVEPEKDCINIVGYYDAVDKVMARSDDTARLLEGLGLKVNCRILNDNCTSEVGTMRKGCMNVMYFHSVYNKTTCRVLEKETGIPWFPKALPTGLNETETWIREFGDAMGVSRERQDSLIDSFRKDREQFEKENKGRYEGKKAVLYCSTSLNINWLLEVLDIFGIRVTNIYCPTNSKWTNSDEVFFAEHGIETEFNIDFDDLCDRLGKVKPDMVLGTNTMLSRLDLPHYNIARPLPGVRSSLECAKRIIRMMEVNSI